jgi:Tfp pilus assembly protein PilX
MTRSRASQQGATLLVTMIMLIMLTLFALSAMNTSIMNLRMVGNMQNRSEALDATQKTIETTISTTRFVDFPNDAIPNPCNGTANTVCTDLNGDGVADLTTTLTPAPTCVQAKITKVNELFIPTPTSEDVACLQAQQQGVFGVAGALTSGDSLCGQTVWNITARTIPTGATTSNAELSYTATQGIGVRVPALAITTSCP